jgi:protein TonB
MFEDMLESTGAKRGATSRWGFPISILTHTVAVGLLVLATLLVTDVVEPEVILNFVQAAAPPPPPPPPPPPAPAQSTPTPKVEKIEPEIEEEIVQPEDIPEEVMVEDTPQESVSGGVVGGVEGGVEGGVVGGVVGGVIGGEIGGVIGGVIGGTGEGPIVPTADTVLPVPIEKPQPEYPEIARAARLEGKVILQAVIGKAGQVEEVTILKSTNKVFDESALAAVKGWKYKPALQSGRPVAVYFTIVVDFELN